MVLASGDPGIDETTAILLPSTAFALVAVSAVVAVAALPVQAPAVVAVAALPVQAAAVVAVAALPVQVSAVAAWVESSCACVFVTGPVMFGKFCFKTRLIFLMWSSAWDRGSVAPGKDASRSSM